MVRALRNFVKYLASSLIVCCTNYLIGCISYSYYNIFIRGTETAIIYFII